MMFHLNNNYNAFAMEKQVVHVQLWENVHAFRKNGLQIGYIAII